MPAPLRVTVEIRALDVGPRLDRVWRLSRDVSEDGVRLWRDLPWEAERPVAVSFRLPAIEPAFACSGQIVAVAPEREEIEGERARPRAVRFTNVPAEARQRLDRYLEERKRT
jgi:hypothetical protein